MINEPMETSSYTSHDSGKTVLVTVGKDYRVTIEKDETEIEVDLYEMIFLHNQFARLCRDPFILKNHQTPGRVFGKLLS